MKRYLEQLAIADPGLADTIEDRLSDKEGRLSSRHMEWMVEDAVWGLSQELSFGRAIALGYADLMGAAGPGVVSRYRGLTRDAGGKGPTLGRCMATYLTPVLLYGGEGCLEKFLETLDVMLDKGLYTLKDPLDALSTLLETGDAETCDEYLGLLRDAFSRKLSYNQCQHFAYTLPRAVRAFSSEKRAWRTAQLRRVIRVDAGLADPFLEGMENGLRLLSREPLDRFVTRGVEKFERNDKRGRKFLALTSKAGQDAFTGLQVAVPVIQVQRALDSYLRARLGRPVSVRPLSDIPAALADRLSDGPMVCSDGVAIYLPDRIDHFPEKRDNLRLFKELARFEAGRIEFGSFDFDLERALDGWRASRSSTPPFRDADPTEGACGDRSDLSRFFLLFPEERLAEDLFTAFEHGRIRVLLSRRYPGLVRRTLPVFQGEALAGMDAKRASDPVFPLYIRVALGMRPEDHLETSSRVHAAVKQWAKRFEEEVEENPRVEACARLVMDVYPEAVRLFSRGSRAAHPEEFRAPLEPPFGRRLRPDLHYAAIRVHEQTSRKVKALLEENGFNVYNSDVRNKLVENRGKLSEEDLREILRSSPGKGGADGEGDPGAARLDPPDLGPVRRDLKDFLTRGRSGVDPAVPDEEAFPALWYDEWDGALGDYLKDHVRVCLRTVPGSEDRFYHSALERRAGLVRRVRRAFELLKPEGLKILRQWVEGDEFDYRALLDAALDKKAGLTPSDRLYVKRIKQQRDVAVLLLVDLSRSTANRIHGSKATVLDVEKEAIVLFCEALQVVGDAFAIAGFSGAGRLGVDYFTIKGFEEPMNRTVRARIGGMAPQRSTRMGAAIRCAADQLDRAPSKVRLLIILGDGFPNDVDYKRDHAIQDTRAAISEARSRRMFTHAITVNISGDPRLDDLYGDVRHTVISDVRELPDKLLRIYGALTKY